MTIRHQIELETISFILFAAFLGSFFAWRSNQNNQQHIHLTVPIVENNTTQNIITPTVIPTISVETTSQISPDGTKKLSMKATNNPDGTHSYVFTTADGSGSNEQQIYSTKLNKPETMNIPFNTWSPDNQYVFIQKNGDALVFKATGEPITTDQTYLDVQDIFNQQNRKDTYKEVTGWASQTLLIVNTVNPDNTKGSSYWFEVPSKAIIQLSSQF